MASYKARAIIGGGLAGYGAGLVERANQQREDAIAQLKRQQQLEDQESERRESRGLLASVETGEGMQAIGVTRGGGRVDLGFKMAPSASSASAGGMSAGDQRLWNAAVERHTTSNDFGNDQVDWAAVATDLRRQGHADLAQLAESSTGGTTIDMNSDEWLRAEQMADDWIAEKTTVLGRDKNELADYGGSRTQARLAKTQEFYRQLTGEAQNSSGEQRAATSGMGDRLHPYTPQTQEEFDRIPAGAFYRDPDDGQLYTKN